MSKGSVSSQWHYWEEVDFKRSLQRDKLLKDCGIPVLPYSGHAVKGSATAKLQTRYTRLHPHKQPESNSSAQLWNETSKTTNHSLFSS